MNAFNPQTQPASKPAVVAAAPPPPEPQQKSFSATYAIQPASSNYYNDKLLDILEKQNKLSLAMTLCQDRASLPKKDLSVFDGSDITQFRSFMLNFERIIESKFETD